MTEADKMKCPDCGAEMNHHADKLVYDAAPDEVTDAGEGGRILEAHACHVCGHSATRTSGAGAGE
jgi:NMD protein affecting ribosome stability and mRNA decay